MPYSYEENALNVVQKLKDSGYKIVCLEISSSSIDIEQFTVNNDEKICLILGSENKGVNQALLDASDVTVHIPMLGVSSSMNVVNACSIANATYAIIRKLQNAR